MAKKEGQNGKISQSKIMAFFTKISGALYDKAKNSFVGGLFCGYDTLNEKAEKGIAKVMLSKLKLGHRVFRPIKRLTSRLVSQSVLLLKLRMFLWSFLSTRVNVYGLFFMTSGIGSLLVSFLKEYVFETSKLSFLDCFVSALLIIMSIPLLFSSVCMSDAIRDSKFLSSFLFDRLGINRVPFERKLKPSSHNNTAWVFGILFCVLSYSIRPHYILLFILLLLYMLSVLFTPEIGVVCLLFVLPFVSQTYLVPLILYTALCWFLKYIRGKRTFKADILSAGVLTFVFIAVFTTAISGDFGASLKPAVLFLCSVLGFFLAENLIKSKEWLRRCMSSLLASYLVVTVFGLLKIFFRYFDNMFTRSLLQAGDGKNIFAALLGMEIRAEYIIILLPAAFSCLITSKRKDKPVAVFAIIMGVVCLFTTYIYGAWIGALVGLLLFFLIGGKRILASMFLLICFVPFIVFYLSPSYIAEITNVGLFSDRANEWLGNIANSYRVFGDFILGGSGVGTYERVSALNSLGNTEHSLYLRLGIELGGFGILMFLVIVFFIIQKSITAYSKKCSSEGRLVSLSSLSGIVALLVMGFGGNVWDNMQICLLFWLMLGLGSAAINIERRSYMAEEILLDEDH